MKLQQHPSPLKSPLDCLSNYRIPKNNFTPSTRKQEGTREERVEGGRTMRRGRRSRRHNAGEARRREVRRRRRWSSRSPPCSAA
jgi:hypothetical protein